MNAFRSRVGTDGIGTDPLRKEDPSGSFPAIINLLLCLALICSSALVPLFLVGSSTSFTLSLIVCVLTASIVIASSKKVFSSIVFVLAMVFSTFYFGTPIIPAILFGTVISVGAGSALLCASRGSEVVCYIISFPLAYGISFLFTGDLLVSLTSLALLLPTLSMGLSAKLKGGRTLSLSLCALSEGLLVCGAFILWVFTAYGAIDLPAFDRAATDMANGFAYYTELAYKTFSSQEITNAMHREIASLASTTVNILPGTIGCACMIAAFLSHSVHMGLMRAYGIDQYTTKKATTLTVSVEAALIFGAAYLISFTTDSSNSQSFAATVAVNLCLILAPCLIHVGFGLILSLPGKLGILGLILWIVFFIILFNVDANPLTVFALIGSATVIIARSDAWAKDFYSKGDRL